MSIKRIFVHHIRRVTLGFCQFKIFTGRNANIFTLLSYANVILRGPQIKINSSRTHWTTLEGRFNKTWWGWLMHIYSVESYYLIQSTFCYPAAGLAGVWSRRIQSASIEVALAEMRDQAGVAYWVKHLSPRTNKESPVNATIKFQPAAAATTAADHDDKGVA